MVVANITICVVIYFRVDAVLTNAKRDNYEHHY